MIGRSKSDIKKLILNLLILSGLTVSLYSQDKHISGVINVYRQVVAIGPGLDNVTLNNVDSTAKGDTVLLIQMKGVIIYVQESGSYGTPKDTVGAPGSSEFLIVESVNTGTKNVIFTNDILKSYNVKGIVQLIKVPFYNSATVIAKTGKPTLTCQPWDSTNKTGGVLALIVGRTLSLEANIDVTGKGFAGGATSQGDGTCTITDLTLYDKYSYPESFTNSGYKGESQVTKVWVDPNIISYYPDYSKGKGANFIGGGGGNGKFSGGGGGSNYGIGGYGGVESNTCGAGNQSGNGLQRYYVGNTDLNGGIFFGGGGGSSTYSPGSTASPGGRGGGIIIIMCDTLKGNGKFIKADGEWPSVPASGNAGAGGGGGGGSIALYQQSFSSLLSTSTSALNISAKGGKGGNTGNSFGEGGGGGGGLILTNNIIFPFNVVPTVTGGTVGTRTGGSLGGTSGSDGEKPTTFTPLLNGFLFNSVRSSVTQNQVDSVCSNMIPPKITGTIPVGGTLPYTYLWKKSYDKITWTPLINDTDPNNYTPTIADAITPTDTVWFRRTITDSSIPIIDISIPVKITVQPFIKNNIVGNPDTICFNGDPPLIQQLLPDLIVPTTKSLFFNWQDSTDISTWGSSKATSKDYDPSAGLPRTSWYRRTVTSGRCVDSTAIVKIKVLPTITNNSILNAPPDICYGMTFPDLLATTAATTPALGGGDNLYRFKWESNINGVGWVTAPGVSNGAGYNPAELPERAPLNQYYFRRIVYSGIHDVCVNTSTPVLLKDFPVITNNTISSDQTICSGSTPGVITGPEPLNGAGLGTFTYTWQDSSKFRVDWTPISGYVNVTNINYPAPQLTDTTKFFYRRIAYSSACSNISKPAVISVDKPILNNSISISGSGPDTTICSGQTPNLLVRTGPALGGGTGSFTYQWVSSPTKAGVYSDITGAINPTYPQGTLIAPKYYKLKVISGTCPSESNIITINVLPKIASFNIEKDQSVCKGQPLPPIISIGTGPTGGDNTYRYTWRQDSVNTGWTNIPGYIKSSSVSYSKSSINDPFKYIRYIYSGLRDCCVDSSNIVSILINPLPTGTITSTADTTLCGDSKVRLKIHLTGQTKWEVIYKEDLTNGPVINIAGTDTTLFVSPVTATDLTTFNYSLGSVVDNNNCTATSLTGSRKADVYKVPKAFAGNDTAVCGPTVLLRATPSYGTGKWYEKSILIGITDSLTVTVDSIFSGGNVPHTFTWEEVNWQCKNKDSVIITFDKRVSSINAGPDTSLFSFDNIIHMVADPVLAWETGLWTVVSGTGDFDDNSKISAEVRNLSKGINKFLWTLTNGTCKLVDFVNIDVYDLVIPEGFSPNNDPGNFNNTFIITGLDLPNQIAELTVVNGAGTEVFSTSNRDSQAWTDWDGKNSKGLDLPEGTYYYLLKITSNGNGQVTKRSGFIVLKRY